MTYICSCESLDMKYNLKQNLYTGKEQSGNNEKKNYKSLEN